MTDQPQDDDVEQLVNWQMGQRPSDRWRQCPQCRTAWRDPDGDADHCDCGYTEQLPPLDGDPTVGPADQRYPPVWVPPMPLGSPVVLDITDGSVTPLKDWVNQIPPEQRGDPRPADACQGCGAQVDHEHTTDCPVWADMREHDRSWRRTMFDQASTPPLPGDVYAQGIAQLRAIPMAIQGLRQALDQADLPIGVGTELYDAARAVVDLFPQPQQPPELRVPTEVLTKAAQAAIATMRDQLSSALHQFTVPTHGAPTDDFGDVALRAGVKRPGANPFTVHSQHQAQVLGIPTPEPAEAREVPPWTVVTDDPYRLTEVTTPLSADSDPRTQGDSVGEVVDLSTWRPKRLNAHGSMLLPHVEEGTLVAIVIQGKTTLHRVKRVDKLAGTIEFEDHNDPITQALNQAITFKQVTEQMLGNIAPYFPVDAIHDAGPTDDTTDEQD